MANFNLVILVNEELFIVNNEDSEQQWNLPELPKRSSENYINV